mmetsp:Transcript_29724/g.52246  ORF Transcript_29724/g.52246 Transcript_29724/m.52246 type:complete len:257 (+) Transcript_29724:73-843(+)
MFLGFKSSGLAIRTAKIILAILLARVSQCDSWGWSQGRSLLLQAVFDAWTKKGNAVLDEAQRLVRHSEVKGGMKPNEFTMSIHDPALALKARPIQAPQTELFQIPSSNVPAGELAILDRLRIDSVEDPGSLGWFQNTREEWTSANGGRSDKSVVLVGNYHEVPLLHHTVKIGFMYIEANNTYPVHAHTAYEIYHIIAGEALISDQSNKTDRLVRRKPGEIIINEPYEKHTLRTEKESVFILWLWVGDTSGYWFSRD